MARTYVYLYGAGAALLGATILMPGGEERNVAVLAAVAATAFSIAAVSLLGFNRLPGPLLAALPAVGTLLIALVVWFGGTELATAYAMFFFWAVLAGCYLFSFRMALLHSAFAIAVCAAIVALRGGVSLPEQRGLLAAGTLVVAAGLVIALRSRVARLMTALDHAASTDPLTGVLNRRRFGEGFAREIERHRRTGQEVALVTFDIDRFKRLNDTLGHDAGDRALRELAAILSNETRAIDLVARLGGDEFAVVAPDAGLEGGMIIAERLRRRIAATFAERDVPFTVSCGIAVAPRHGADSERLLRAGDRALYRAKRQGRNRTEIAVEVAEAALPGGAAINAVSPAPR